MVRAHSNWWGSQMAGVSGPKRLMVASLAASTPIAAVDGRFFQAARSWLLVGSRPDVRLVYLRGDKALIAARNAASAAFRAAHAGHLDLAYGATQREAWDLYPGGDPSAPTLAFIRGSRRGAVRRSGSRASRSCG